MESRIPGDRYVRFGGEFLETCHSKIWQGAGFLSYTYTTEKPEKSAVEYYVQEYGSYDKALVKIVDDLKIFGDSLENLVSLVNLYQNPLDRKINSYYKIMKQQHKGKNVFKIISQELEDRNISFSELINLQNHVYENV